MDTCKVAVIAALERELSGLARKGNRVNREHDGRRLTFFELADTVIVASGIGLEAARRAAEAAASLYHPEILHSVGFAGALQPDLCVGDVVSPAAVIDARDGSRTSIEGGTGLLLTSAHVAGVQQKAAFAQAYGAQAVDMEAAAVAAAARAHGLAFRATKVISDGFDFEMPEMERFIDSQGRFKTAGFALFVTLRPWLWPRVLTLASNSKMAAKTLAACLSEAGYLSGEAIHTKTI